MRRTIVGLIGLLLVGCGQTAVPPGIAPQATSTPTLAAPTAPVAGIPDQPDSTPAPPRALPTVAIAVPPTPASSGHQLATLEQALALRPEAATDASLPALPFYTMLITANPAAGTFSGSQIITFTNITGTSLPDLLLRSYVNFPRDIMGDGGDTTMNITGATLAGQPLAIKAEAQRTAFRLILPTSLAPQAQLTIQTTFTGTLKPWQDGSWPFLSSYPMLAQWDASTSTWRTDVTLFPDRVFAATALYDVTVILPNPLQIFATGSAISSSDAGANTVTRFVTGPVREWAASFGRFAAVSTVTDGITVTVYQVQDDNLDSERMREIAVKALESYERRFGKYPYRELDLHAMDWGGDAGIEYPGYTLILINNSVNERTDFVVAHEVAHQWWYAVVGNDIYREAWLDESITNYSAIIATEDRAGAKLAQTLFAQEIDPAYQRNLQVGDPPAGLAITDYASFGIYYRAIYGKGAVFLRQLRAELGDEVFFAGLQAYYSSMRYQVGSRTNFENALEQAAGYSLDTVFDQWLGEN